MVKFHYDYDIRERLTNKDKDLKIHIKVKLTTSWLEACIKP